MHVMDERVNELGVVENYILGTTTLTARTCENQRFIIIIIIIWCIIVVSCLSGSLSKWHECALDVQKLVSSLICHMHIQDLKSRIKNKWMIILKN
jgi:hypothetical protein